MDSFTIFHGLNKEMRTLKLKERNLQYGRQIRMRERGRSWVCFYQKDNGIEKLEPLADLLRLLYDDKRQLFPDTGDIAYTSIAYQTLSDIHQQYEHFHKPASHFSPNWIGYLAFQLGLGDEFVAKNSAKKTKGYVRKIGTRGFIAPDEHPAVMIQCESPNGSLHELWNAIANAMGLEMVETYIHPSQRQYVNTDATGRYFKMRYHLIGDGIETETNGISFNSLQDLMIYLHSRFEGDEIFENYTPIDALLKDSGNLKRSKRILEAFDTPSTPLTLMEFYKAEQLKIYPYQLHD